MHVVLYSVIFIIYIFVKPEVAAFKWTFPVNEVKVKKHHTKFCVYLKGGIKQCYDSNGKDMSDEKKKEFLNHIFKLEHTKDKDADEKGYKNRQMEPYTKAKEQSSEQDSEEGGNGENASKTMTPSDEEKYGKSEKGANGHPLALQSDKASSNATSMTSTEDLMAQIIFFRALTDSLKKLQEAAKP